jgi:hypothetical protein
VNVTPAAYVVLENGRTFDLLYGIRTEVTEILNAPQVAAALK